LWLSQYKKGKTSVDFSEVMGFGMAAAPAGPYANNLQLAPDNHTNTSSLRSVDHIADGWIVFIAK